MDFIGKFCTVKLLYHFQTFSQRSKRNSVYELFVKVQQNFFFLRKYCNVTESPVYFLHSFLITIVVKAFDCREQRTKT